MAKNEKTSVYSNSGLVDYVMISPFKTSGRTHAIDTITIHCMQGQLTVESCGDIFQQQVPTPRNASSNYGVGKDGRIGLYVEEKDRSWCSSNGPNDNRAVTIEVASDATHPFAVNDVAYEAMIKLVVDICQRNGIKQLKWKGDKSLIGQVNEQNMTVHRWFSNKLCPGDYLYNKHLEIANEVNSRMGAPKIPPLEDIQDDDTESNEPEEDDEEETPKEKRKKKTSEDSDEDSEAEVLLKIVTSPNSRLVDYTNRVVTGTDQNRSGAIEGITVHIAKKVGDIEDLAKMINSSTTTYNYGIDTYGTIGLFADETVRTNATGNKANDDRCINIVCMNSQTNSNYPISGSTYDALVALCSDICRRNYIEYFTYRNKPKKDALTLHDQFASGANCPGPYFTKKIPEFVKDVNARLQQDWAKANARVAETNEAALYIQSGINLDAIKPYVISPDKDQVGISYKAFRDIGVVGVMLDAGMYLDKNQKVTKKYRNENLYTQVEEVTESKLPYGFYYTTHAATIEDVKQESYWLYFIIAKYPPKLGIWLKVDLNTKMSQTQAQAIVEKYYATFVEWGLKSKCGIYATKEQAKLIGWPRQCTYMPLWLAGQMTNNTCPDEEILTPSFFRLDDLTNKGYKKGQKVYDPYPNKYDPNKNYEEDDEEEEDDEPKRKKKKQEDEDNTDKSDDESSNEDTLVDKAKRTVAADGTTTIVIPQPSMYKGFKALEPYTALSNKRMPQYELQHLSRCITDDDGFRRINGRYMIAVGYGILNIPPIMREGVVASIGQHIDVILENGTVIKAIVGDAKATNHTDDSTEEIFTSVTNNWCCSEFIVDWNHMDSPGGAAAKRAGSASKRDPSWDSKVVKFKMYTTNELSKV